MIAPPLSCLDTALALERAGLWALCLHGPETGGKRPRLNAWQRQRQTADMLRRDFEAYPTSNVGVVTGAASGIVCVDIDPRNGGLEWWDANRERLLGGICYLEQTGSGGFHVVYRHPGGHIPTTHGEIADGVDLLGDIGQFVCAPSIHANGNPYRALLGGLV